MYTQERNITTTKLATSILVKWTNMQKPLNSKMHNKGQANV